jgi:hypothetical protein
MEVLEYRFHAGARSSLKIAAVLCCLLVVSAPIGIWVWLRAVGGKVRVTPVDVAVKGLGGTSFRFDEVARMGLLQVRIVARGIGGALVRRRVGGNDAFHLVVKTTNGKTRKFIASSYENYRELIATLSERAHKPIEPLRVGLLGPKWPEEA